ncbi:MAG: hypothetical protein HZC54_00730 [Verrucomicrobia bacterium]|nr:hypothetical protein [Verrucomicrobiota bacterium]
MKLWKQISGVTVMVAAMVALVAATPAATSAEDPPLRSFSRFTNATWTATGTGAVASVLFPANPKRAGIRLFTTGSVYIGSRGASLTPAGYVGANTNNIPKYPGSTTNDLPVGVGVLLNSNTLGSTWIPVEEIGTDELLFRPPSTGTTVNVSGAEIIIKR